MQPINNNTPPYVRSTGETITFWLLWLLLSLPVFYGFLLFSEMSGLNLLILPIFAQLALHAYSAWLFFDKNQSFSKTLMWLLGGTGVLYMLFIGGCFVALLSNTNNIR
jgi:hypothetical protein